MKNKENKKTFNDKKESIISNFIIHKVTNKLQNLSRVLVFPIAILPLAGILFGIGGGFLAAATKNNWSNGLISLFTIMKGIGSIVFSSLGLMFAGSIAFGFSKHSKGVAAISGVLAYLGMEITISMLFLPYQKNGQWYVQLDPWHLTGSTKEVNNAVSNGFLQTVLGISPTIDLSIMGGIIIGWLTCLVHNKTYKIQLLKAFAFFSGEKFVPIASFLMGIAMGIFGFFTFPILMYLFHYIGQGLGKGMGVGSKEHYHLGVGVIISYLLGSLEQLLIPTGLNNCFYTNFWYTSSGGQALSPVIEGNTIVGWNNIVGAYNIFFDQMSYIGRDLTMTSEPYKQLIASGSSYASLAWEQNGVYHIAFNHYTTEVGTGFMSGRFAVYNYGLPAAGLAIIFTSAKENRQYVSGLMGSAIVTCFTTGIIEPLVFAFVFIAPILYGIHVAIGGLSYAFCYMLNVQCGNGFTAGFIDYCFFGLFPGYSTGISYLGHNSSSLLMLWAGRNGSLFVPIFGLVIIAPLYYFSFYYTIKKMNLKTPGRETKGEINDSTLAVKASLSNNDKVLNVNMVIDGLGGIDNILEINNCASRLRVPVDNINKVDVDILMKTGAYGTKIDGNHIQVIYGPRVTIVASLIREYLEKNTKKGDKNV